MAIKLGQKAVAEGAVSGKDVSFVVALPFNNAKSCVTFQFNGGFSCFPASSTNVGGAPGSNCDKQSEAED